MRKAWWYLSLAASLFAQPPAIRTNGVVNAASGMPPIVRGALFTIYGIRLGAGVQTASVWVGEVQASLLSVTPQRIEARLPANAPPGDATLVVTASGRSSAPYALKVALAGFGIFTRNEQGWGPGRIENIAQGGARSANRIGNAARPGQTAALLGTGLGKSHPEVWIGGRRAAVRSFRPGLKAAPDEIVFEIPHEAPAGCYVPVQVRVAGTAPSNTATLSIQPGGGRCQPSPAFPVAAWPAGAAGVVILSRTRMTDTEGGPSSTTDEGTAMFVSHQDEDETLGPMLLIPPLGTCGTYARTWDTQPQAPGSAGDTLLSSIQSAGLDAGPNIAVVSRSRVNRLTASPGALGVYRRILGKEINGRADPRVRLFFAGGDLQIGGEGGSGVGPFHVTVPGPEPFTWTNRDSIRSIDRARGVTLEWQPLASDSVMLIALTSGDAPVGLWGACYCAAPGAAGHFTIPPEMLTTLPASHPLYDAAPPSLFLMAFLAGGQREIAAKGLDHGLVTGVFVEATNARVR